MLKIQHCVWLKGKQRKREIEYHNYFIRLNQKSNKNISFIRLEPKILKQKCVIRRNNKTKFKYFNIKIFNDANLFRKLKFIQKN